MKTVTLSYLSARRKNYFLLAACSIICSLLLGAAKADDLQLNALALRDILYPAPHTAQQTEICANLLRYNNFRNMVSAFTGTLEEIKNHGYEAYVEQTLPNGLLRTNIPQNGHDLFVDLKLVFSNSVYSVDENGDQGGAASSAVNYGLNNPVYGWSYQPRLGLFPPGTEVFLVMWHGAGGSISHAGSVLPVMRYLMNRKTSNYKKTIKALSERNHGTFVPAQISAEAFDFPFCGNHCDTFAPHQADLPQTLAHLAQYFKVRRKQAMATLGHDIPIIVFARSAAAGVLTAFNQAYPDMINGLILIGPTAPGLGEDDLGYQDSLDHLKEEIHEGKTRPNYQSIIYMDKLYHQMTAWKKTPDPFNGVSTLVMVGENDLETPGTIIQNGKLIPTKMRAWLYDNARHLGDNAGNKLPHLYFSEIPDGRHDVFSRYPDQEDYDNITPLSLLQLWVKGRVEAFKAAQNAGQAQSF